MRITVNPSFSWETLKLVAHDGVLEYYGTVIELKGGASAAPAKSLINTSGNLAAADTGEANGIEGQILPFLSGELTNPQGMGQQGLGEAETAGGQAVAGSLAGAEQQGKLGAARTGNPASIQAINDATTRAGMRQQSNNALDTNLENTNLKLAQQQAGAGGLERLFGQNQSAGLESLGIENNAISNYIKSKQSQIEEFPADANAVANLASGAGKLASGAASV